MFSKSCEYAIRSIIFLASFPTGEPVNISLISKAIDSPNAYTAKILQKLSKKKIINSVKGQTGGYFIDKIKLDKIYIAQVVDAIDGDSIYTSCALGLKQCSNTNPCALHEKFKKIRNDLKVMLENTTVKNLITSQSMG